MKLRPIPDPVLKPYPRKHRPDLKPLVQVTVPKTQAPVQSPETKQFTKQFTKQEVKPSVAPQKLPKNPAKAQDSTKNQPVNDKPAAPEKEKQEAPTDGTPLVKLDDGTEVPKPFKPVDIFTALSSPHPGIATVALRQLKDMKGPMPDTSSGALAVLEKFETGLKGGVDISGIQEEIAALIMGEEEHNELFRLFTNSIDRERLMEIYKSRAKWEDFCHSCMRRSDVNIIEGMSLMSYFNAQLGPILARLEKKQKGEVTQSREAQDLVDKVNRPTIIQNKQLQRKFDAASPQEREIIRKLGFKLEGALTATITKTTTETVEIVQPNAS